MKRQEILNSAFWTYMIVGLIQEMFEVFFSNGRFANYIAYLAFLFIVIVLFLFSDKKHFKNSVLICASILLILVINTYLYPSTTIYMKDDLLTLTTRNLPLLLLLSNITLWDDFYIKMKKIALPYYIIGVIYYIGYLLGYGESTNYMRMAYNVLLPVCLTGVVGVYEKRIIYQLIFWISLIAIFISGCRGALFVGVCVYFSLLAATSTNIRRISKISFIVLILGIIFIQNISQISNILSSVGFESRTIQKLTDDSIFDSSGRDELRMVVLANIQQKGYWPQGLYSDRKITDQFWGEAVYVHNIILEFIVDFGIFLGIVLFISLLSSIYKIAKKSDTLPRTFLLLFATYSLTKLMVSSSYLIEPSFYCMLGLMIAIYRYNKNIYT